MEQAIALQSLVPRPGRVRVHASRSRRAQATRRWSTSSAGARATASSSPRRWRSWRDTSGSRLGSTSATRPAKYDRRRPGWSARTTPTRGPSSTSTASAGCGSSRRRAHRTGVPHRAGRSPNAVEPTPRPDHRRPSPAASASPTASERPRRRARPHRRRQRRRVQVPARPGADRHRRAAPAGQPDAGQDGDDPAAVVASVDPGRARAGRLGDPQGRRRRPRPHLGPDRHAPYARPPAQDHAPSSRSHRPRHSSGWPGPPSGSSTPASRARSATSGRTWPR